MSDTATAPAPLAIQGDLTIYRAAELRQTLLTALAQPGDTLALDLSGVTELDSAGLQLLLSARRTAQAGGRTLDFLAPSPPLLQTWQMLGLPTQGEADPLGGVLQPDDPNGWGTS
ncbi:STAS domain-containing protein [Amphibiibacter pelophylacis]|uniref:STAS domain-containing protein n=1 Tax=Amphibiibacter pelophylacis TaxID=1799477 RepID=A0ACC6P2C0_9BURK